MDFPGDIRTQVFRNQGHSSHSNADYFQRNDDSTGNVLEIEVSSQDVAKIIGMAVRFIETVSVIFPIVMCLIVMYIVCCIHCVYSFLFGQFS